MPVPVSEADPNAPLVSVVTAALDPPLGKLLRCIESVEAQDYPRIEHTVVDGGSTNGALEVLAEHPRSAALDLRARQGPVRRDEQGDLRAVDGRPDRLAQRR